MHPPRKALEFLRWFCREDYIEEIEGDLIELFEDRYDKLSPRKANRKFIWDVIRSFRLRNIKKVDLSYLKDFIMFKHYLKIGGRQLIKNKGFSGVSILGLAMGIACCLSLFVFAEYESSFDSFHPYTERSYRVVQHTQYVDETLYWNTTAYPLAEALREDFPNLDLVTQTAGPFNKLLTVENSGGNNHSFESRYTLYVDSYYAKVFELNWLSGDKNTAFNQPYSIVLTESFAKKIYGGSVSFETLLGKRLLLEGKEALQITGIIQDAPGNSTLQYEFLIPYELFRLKNPDPASNWSGNHGGTTFLVASENQSSEEIESAIQTWQKKYLSKEDNSRIQYKLQPLSQMHTDARYGSSPGSYNISRSTLINARYVGICILLIAIGNFVNLVTARSVNRAKEVGIRKSIGSSRFDLFQQFTWENSLIVIISIVFSLLLSSILFNQANQVFSSINLELSLKWSHVGVILIIGFITVLLGTSYPALILSRFQPLQIIKNRVPFSKTRGISTRKAITVFQFMIVQIFVIATIIAAFQMDLFKHKPLGFSSEAVLMTPIPQADKTEFFKNQLQQTSNVLDVTIGSGPPMAVNGLQLGSRYRIPEMAENEGYETELKIGDDNYLNFYDIELLAGKNFMNKTPSFNEFIVNESLIKTFDWTPEEAIGRKIITNEGEATIIGVMKDFHNNSLQNEISACILINWEYFKDKAFIKLSNLDSDAIRDIEESWKKAFSGSVFSYEFVDDSIHNEYFVETLIFNGFTLFSIVAILIGSLGLIGLMTFLTTQRTKEVGIRKVFGASVSEIIHFFSKEFTFLIGVAFLLALPITYLLMEYWLENFTYRITMTWWMFICGGLATLLIAALSSFTQAFKAAYANPIVSIKTE
ncbi:ABC transporter permease [Algoriphagus formosus]|uniref:ABC transporter permease n=1 Tax=Algoriphagus formosus TaxID=2007308 RepID=UPI000C2814C5|nr:FtsX-like permease family protein [Algoriphagus formosus]